MSFSLRPNISWLFILCIWCLAPPATAQVLEATVTPIASDAGIKQRPFISSILDLTQYDYVEQEFILSGNANTYDKAGKWLRDGMWDVTVSKADMPYATRMIVRRPEKQENFNGMVVVEWLNNTAFMDVDVIWAQSHDELLREGYAWIGLSAQYLGVSALRSWDKERYGELSIANDGLSYDIFSQAALAVRNQSDLLLGGLTVTGIIGAGESQSAIRLTTYVNAFQDSANEVYDAILIYSRFHLAAPLKAGITALTPSRAYIRPDNRLKILQLQTEQDIFMFLFRLARQDDTEFLRTWEVAGASHYDNYGVSFLLPQYQRDFPALGEISLNCRNSLNLVPQRYVVNAALSHMSNWITTDQAPPQSTQIEYRNWKVVRDEHGNALGGIRLPEVEVPIATHNYANSGSFTEGNWLINSFACPFLGNTVPFSDEKLQGLYSSHDEYVSQFTDTAMELVEAGFLLPADFNESVENAKAVLIP